MQKPRSKTTIDRLTRVYLGFVCAVLAALIVILLRYLCAYASGVLVTAAMALCLVGLISHPVISITNSVLRLFFPSLTLPAIESDKVAPEHTTLVVIPDLILDSEKIDALADTIREHYLLNDDPNIFFGVLTDWGDSATEHAPTDDERLSQIVRRIQGLNATYGSADRRPFFLLHRGRRWNAYDNCWMGYERKRGKLEDVNDLILHGNSSPFITVEGDMAAISRAKYVLTLDNDSRLPRGAALKLISAIAHPANRPEFDDKGVIVSGYGILQPRMMAAQPVGPSTWIERFWVRLRGSNPERPQFDIFQDFFGEGCFTGVGIYSVADFDRALRGMIPENHLLSHDVIEGCFARAGRAGHVVLYESVPPTYHAASRRHHRWMRGDWQNCSWLFPFVPSANGRQKNSFSLLSRWKIFKCMLASLFPASIALLPFTCAVTGHTYGGVMVVAASVLLPIMVDITVKRLLGLKLSLVRATKDCLFHTFLTITLAAFEGMRNINAACTAIYRISGSKRRGLEWVPSSAYDSDDLSAVNYIRYMWTSPAVAVLLAVWMDIWSARPNAPILAVMGMWAIAPLVAWQISRRQPNVAAEAADSGVQREPAR